MDRLTFKNHASYIYEGCSKSIGPLAEKNTFTRLEVCNPNLLRSSLLVTEHTSPSGSAIVRSISGMPLCEWSTTDSKLLGQTQHSCGSTDSLLSRHGSLRFLAVPPPENAAERDSVCHETTLYGTRRPSCTPFAKRHSRNALNKGGTARKSVFSHKETTSKGIRFADLQACKCIFPGQRSDTFWTALVSRWRLFTEVKEPEREVEYRSSSWKKQRPWSLLFHRLYGLVWSTVIKLRPLPFLPHTGSPRRLSCYLQFSCRSDTPQATFPLSQLYTVCVCLIQYDGCHSILAAL